jgi:hypothetical protein
MVTKKTYTNIITAFSIFTVMFLLRLYKPNAIGQNPQLAVVWRPVLAHRMTGFCSELTIMILNNAGTSVWKVNFVLAFSNLIASGKQKHYKHKHYEQKLFHN